MPGRSGAIAGPDAHARAVALAGFLAELGVQSLELSSAAGRQILHARATDLPGLLARFALCRLSATGLAIDVTADAVTWHADPPLADRPA